MDRYLRKKKTNVDEEGKKTMRTMKVRRIIGFLLHSICLRITIDVSGQVSYMHPIILISLKNKKTTRNRGLYLLEKT